MLRNTAGWCEIGWVQLDLPKKLLSIEKVHVPSAPSNFVFLHRQLNYSTFIPSLSFEKSAVQNVGETVHQE